MKKTGVLGLLALMMVLLLAACGESHEAMVRQLEALERQNRADSVMTNDSLAEALTRYFDHHGTPNERMRAHYILGRTYADMGEAPAALNAYLDAADCADTTATDCDYHTLSRVYGQMSGIFYQQNLMEDYLKSLDYSVRYAWIAKDTLQALRESATKVAGYDRLKQYDSIITAFDDVFDKLLQYYGFEMAAGYAVFPLNALLNKDKIEKCKYCLDIIERESGYFDSVGNIEKGREVFYYYKGKYFMVTQQFDSAEYYFRKELQTGLDVTNQSMASRGLSLVFDKTHRSDSAAKYAIYSYEMNDSVYAQMATKEVEQAHATFKYNRHQQEAQKERRKAEQEEKKNVILLVILVSICTIACCIAHFWRKKQKADAVRFHEKEEELERAQSDLANLHIIEAEVESLRSNEALLSNMIQEKEATVAKLLVGLEQLKNREKKNRTIAIVKLNESPVYRSLKNKAKRCEKLSYKDWKEIDSLIKDALPAFYEFLQRAGYDFGSSKYRICVLFRLNIGVQATGNMLEVSTANISQLSTKILRECFDTAGSGKELFKKLQEIN